MTVYRNLVTSLFEHEQIKTTLPKARDTARLAEKVQFTQKSLLFTSDALVIDDHSWQEG